MADPCVRGRSIAPGHACCEGHATCQLRPHTFVPETPLAELTDAQLVDRLEVDLAVLAGDYARAARLRAEAPDREEREGQEPERR